MKNSKALIAAIISIAVLIAGVTAAIILTNVFSNKNESEQTSTTAQLTTTEPSVAASSRPKSEKPDSIVAAVYGSYSEKTTEEIAGFEENGFNTIVFELTADNTAQAAQSLTAAATAKLFFGVRADVEKDSAYLTDFITENNVDFVILSGCDNTAAPICEKIRKTDSLIQIGIEPSYCSNATKSITQTVTNGLADFIFLVQNSNDETGIKVFKAGQSAWNEETCPLWLCHSLLGLSDFSSDKTSEMIDLISRSADMPMGKGLAFYPYSDINGAKGTSAQAITEYIKTRDTYLLDKEFSVSNYSSTTITVEKPNITFKGTSSPLSDLLCNGQKVKVATTGDFSVDVKLNAGENTVKFEHKGKTYTYKVTYKIKLLKSVSPSEYVSVPGGMDVEVSAIALKGATLTVTFNGKSYKMTQTESADSADDNSPDTDSDFSTYTATLQTPEGKTTEQKLGAFTVKATYGSLTETLKGGSVTVTANEPVPEPPVTQPTTTTTTTATAPETQPVTNETEGSSEENDTQSSTEEQSEVQTETTRESVNSGSTLQKYKYTSDYGLGSARICEIIDDYVEVYPGNTSKTYSVPDCSPLLKGTVDYVKSTAELDGDTYYILASGVKVPKGRTERLASGENGTITHVRITNGYVMPKNNIEVVSTKCTEKETLITLDMNRTVAFNAKLIGQTYGSYNGRPVTVSSLTCTAIEFTFSDTSTAAGSFSFSNSVCKNAKWSSDSSANTVTLTINLAKAGKFYGFHYEYGQNGTIEISIKNKPNSLSGYTIMLDPGHGGLDVGAICAVPMTDYAYEKQINLSLATKIKDLLEAEGATVIMTRTTDKWVCYAERNEDVRAKNPDMFISIHCDSSSSSSATGTSAYYYRAYSQPLAKAIHERLVDAYKDEIYKGQSGIKIDRGANFYAFRVTRVEECPAILIEYGFISNTSECETLQNASNRNILAKATVEGIKDYISAS